MGDNVNQWFDYLVTKPKLNQIYAYFEEFFAGRKKTIILGINGVTSTNILRVYFRHMLRGT